MAERRMFSKQIIDSDVFLDMPLSTQALYFHLSMRADDEGFINKPKMIMRMIGASQNELELLLAKRYLLSFDSGVVVVKHWRIHNYIQKDRFKPTLYKEERDELYVKENKSYTEKGLLAMDTECIQDGYTGKVSIGKISIGEESKDNTPREKKSFLDPIINYWNNKGNLSRSLSSLNIPNAGQLANIINDYGDDYVKEAIDGLSRAIESGQVEKKYQPGSLGSFLEKSVSYWHEYEGESTPFDFSLLSEPEKLQWVQYTKENGDDPKTMEEFQTWVKENL